MELLTLGLFCGALLLCVLLDYSILYALTAGLVLFLLYGRSRGFGWRALGVMALDGIRTVKNILITFVLIGMLTALWREAGTIPVLVCYASRLIRPEIFLLMAFLLNCLVSVMTGTAFGTAATMGVICATMAAAVSVNPLLVGGAVLSGVFFGDRCSPVSTSALLVSELTGTNIFDNLRAMVKSAAVPFLVSCLFYGVLGLATRTEGVLPDLYGIFGQAFRLHWTALLPALVVLTLALFRVNVKAAMGASILTALPICLLVQHTPWQALPGLLLSGYDSELPQVAALLKGGGIRSMVRVGAIVCLSSSYSGIFRKTGLLEGLQHRLEALARRTTPYAAMLLTGIGASMIACNQTLAIMLTHQLCGAGEREPTRLALDLEDTAVVLSPLIPWSIACAVPLASVGAPTASVLLAVFLWLLPLWRLSRSLLQKQRGTGR